MSRLDELIKEKCPNGVQFYTLAELEDNQRIKLGRGNVISKDEIKNNPGDYPVYSSSALNNGIIGLYSKYMFDDERITWSIDGGGKFFYRPASKYSVTNVCGWLTVFDCDINTKYLYYVLSSEWEKKVFDYVHKAHPSVIRKEYRIPIPPLEVQNEIVQILDNFAELTAELTAELSNRKKQYEYYKEFLFSNLDSTAVSTKEVSADRFWLMPATPRYISEGIPYITSKNIKDGQIILDDIKYISEDDYENISKNRSIKENDLLITMIGTIGETALVGKETKFYGQNIYLVRMDESKCLSKYFQYYLSMKKIRDKLISKKNASSQGYIKAGSIDELKFPLPPIHMQKKIVDILDKFSALNSSMLEGLPAEINARKKQYSYYSNKLLTFEEAK